MIGSLPTWQWAVSDGAAPLLAALSASPSLSRLAGLRKDWSPEQIAVCSELVAARERGAKKFPTQAAGLVADREGLEMASSWRAGVHKARRFAATLPAGAPVLDACCGVGGDAMALAGTGLTVTALDLDERRAWMAGVNARCEHVACDVRGHPCTTALHIDPARRSDGGRTQDLDGFEPPFEDVEALVRNAPFAAVKLNPGVRADLLPDGELEIISERGRLTQAVLWLGSGVRPARRATLLAGDGATHTLVGQPDRPDEAHPVGGWVYTMDAAIERADLVGEVIDGTPLRLVHPGTGLLTSDAPWASPWTSSFRVEETLSWSIRGVKQVLRGMGAGLVTVKTRAGVVDADRLSRQLRGKGDRDVVVFVLPIGDRVRAIVTERVDVAHERTPPDSLRSSGGVWMAE